VKEKGEEGKKRTGEEGRKRTVEGHFDLKNFFIYFPSQNINPHIDIIPTLNEGEGGGGGRKKMILINGTHIKQLNSFC
jgi:hypothetical protein